MGYAIIWSSGLAAALFLVATAAAFSARLKRRWVKVLAPAVAALPALALGVSAVASAAVLRACGIRKNWLGYSLSWTVLLLAGTVLIIVFALRRRRDGGTVPRGVLWPREKLALSFAAALAVCVCTLLYMDAVVRLELVKVRGDARALALFLAPSRVPDRENAALVYRQAFEIMRPATSTLNVDSFQLKGIEEPDFDATSPDGEQILFKNRLALPLLRKAAAMPACYFENHYAWPPIRALPELKTWFRATDLLVLEARSKAAKGDTEGAAKNIMAIWRMSEHASARPNLISSMIRIAIEARGSEAAENVLAVSSETPPDIVPLPIEPWTSVRETYARALLGEQSLSLWVASDLSGGEVLAPDRPFPPLSAGSLWRVFLLPADLAAYRYWMLRWQEIAAMPYYEARAKRDELQEEFSKDRGGLLTSIAFPSFLGGIEVIAEAESSHHLACLGLAAVAYRGEKGAYPDKVGDLVPHYVTIVPIDPFSGDPLRMLAVEGGLVLYSVGRDGVDDGGAEEKDITFCLGSAYRERRLERAREEAPPRGAPPE